MDKGTIKEICDVVTSEVMKRVQSNLSDMKPELVRSVTEAASRKAIEAATQVADVKCRTYEERITQLEAKIAKLTLATPPPAQPKAERISAKAIDGVTTLSTSQIDDILSFPNYCREANEWIYYIKVVKQGYDGYGELYKVRLDGTMNQKIFEGKVSNSETAANLFFRIWGDKVQFRDADDRMRSIKV